ncbi:hypothetical protein [Caballeronia sordidicola]|jgi:hypothetical protein|uniref:hypothetical protein n=1 Tax=Caballeronia sordidicola TaxID=196367 RepID=UPI000B7796F3|nr:hypothetical protein [Caballeronia sordidicola]
MITADGILVFRPFALSPFRPFALSPNYIEELVANFGALTAEVPRRPIASRAQYLEAVRVLNALLDAGAANEEHEFGGPVVALDELIERDDEVHYVLTVRLTRPRGEHSRTMFIERFGARV